MGIFAQLTRRQSTIGSTAPAEPGRELSDDVRRGLPARFEAVGEALAAGVRVHAVCAEVGRDTARDGAALGEALDGLRSTYARVVGREPDYAAAAALGSAWGEETLAYVNQLSCEDPLTGLASAAHLRARLSEVYRGAEQNAADVSTSHALVVVHLPPVTTGVPADRFTQALWMVRVTETVRTVFSGAETVGQLGRSRLVVLADRTEALGRQVWALRELIEELEPRGRSVRVWIEGLPSSSGPSAALLDELTRV